MPKERFVIVGASDVSSEDLDHIKKEDFVCAADAGYLSLHDAGISADLIIGDFDSMPKPDTAGIETITLPVVKDDTDISYCIKEGIKRGYSDFLILGALGGMRLSHTMANIQLLCLLRDLGGNGQIRHNGTVLRILRENEKIEIPGRIGDHFSIFALSEDITVSLSGLYYPLDHGVIKRGFPLGVSNHFTKECATALIHKGEALIITEKQE